MATTSGVLQVRPTTNPTDITFSGSLLNLQRSTLSDFWNWAFSDLCDDDIKGIFAEWMVGVLLGGRSLRRVSWADCDIALLTKRIEVKSTAIWQSWKLVNPDGTRMDPFPPPHEIDPRRIRFSGLKARTAERVVRPDEVKQFKADIYVFCLHNQTDPAAWDAWNLDQWEFYVMEQRELIAQKIKGSISLAGLRKLRPPMSAAQLQSYVHNLVSLNSSGV